jgi:hypothetical protein
MKSLKQYFLEYSSPDTVDHVIDEQPVSFDYMSEFAYPFFYNTKTNEIIIGYAGETHGRTLDKYVDAHSDWRKKFNIDSPKYDYIITPLDLIFTRFDSDGPLKPSHIIFGRIWDLTNVYEYEEINDETSGGVKQFIIAYWNELNDKSFKNVTDTIINKFCKDNNYNISDYTVYAVDNNNYVIDYTHNKKFNKRTEKNKRLVNSLQAIHLATQKEKRSFYKEYRRNRNEFFQKTRYNKTKSKTEAEWRNIMYKENKNI